MASVYDGHEGSAVSELLSSQLHPAVTAAVQTAWRSSCTLLQNPALQNALTAAAHSINARFLAAARQHQQQQKDRGSSPATSASGRKMREWDADDGSTAVFAVIAGQQLLVGNVGNSRAVLCTAASSSSSSRLVDHTAAAAAAAASSSNGSSSSSTALTQRTAAAGHGSIGAVGQAHNLPLKKRGSSSSSTALSTQRPGSCIAPHPTGSSASSSSSSSSSGEPPLLPLQLSFDHTPARGDEAARIIAAGGSIAAKRPGGKARVTGELEVTRSFGDVGYVDKVCMEVGGGVLPRTERGEGEENGDREGRGSCCSVARG